MSIDSAIESFRYRQEKLLQQTDEATTAEEKQRLAEELRKLMKDWQAFQNEI